MEAPLHPARGLGAFLKSLVEEGRAVVSVGPPANDDASALHALRRLDEMARAELGMDAPPLSTEAALWAARLFYHLCQFTVCRDIGEERIKTECRIPCPAPRDAASDWSADLTLRHLPKLFQLARHLSNADPLVEQLKCIAAAWPLSSVGIPGLEKLQPVSFADEKALRRLYADRIIAAEDSSRLGDRRVDEMLQADLGVHRDLAPDLAKKLFKTHDTH